MAKILKVKNNKDGSLEVKVKLRNGNAHTFTVADTFAGDLATVLDAKETELAAGGTGVSPVYRLRFLSADDRSSAITELDKKKITYL